MEMDAEMMGLQEKKKKKRRKRIQAAATTLFQTNGYADTTINAIADRADVGVGTIYNYFSSKSEILLNIVADIFLEKKPDETIHEKDPAQTAIRFLSYYMDEFSIFEKEIWRGWFAALFQEPKLFERAYELDMKIVGELAGVCEAMQAKGMITDQVPPLEIAKLLYTPFISLVMSYIMLEDMTVPDAKKEFERQVTLIFRGLDF
jgi:AcrR family transcriptional regulator